MLLPPHPSPSVLPMAEDMSAVMEGGTIPELAVRRIREGAVTPADTFPAAANAPDLIHPCAAEEPAAAPAAGRPESFESPGGQGGGKCGEVAAGDDIDGSGANGAAGGINIATFSKSWEGAVSPDDTFPMPVGAADLMHPDAAYGVEGEEAAEGGGADDDGASGAPGYKTRRQKGRNGSDVRVGPNRDMGAVELAMRNSSTRTTKYILETVVGTAFDSLSEAYEFYNLYSWEVGFGIRYGNNYTNDEGYRSSQDLICQMQEGRFLVLVVDGLCRLFTTLDRLMYIENGILDNMWRHWMPASFAAAVLAGDDWLSPGFRDMMAGDHLGYSISNYRMIIMPLPMDCRWVTYVWDFQVKIITVLDPYLQHTSVARLKWEHDDTMDCLHQALFDCKEAWFQGWEVNRHNSDYNYPIALGRRCREYNSGVYAMHYALHFDGKDVRDVSVEDGNVLVRGDMLYKMLTMPGNSGELPAFLDDCRRMV